MGERWTHTSRGRALDLLDPKPDDIDWNEIARSLSHQCRFAGNVKQFYSVAEHSVLIARWLRGQGHNAGIVLGGLLHDAHEAYIGDMIQPLQAVLFADAGMGVRRRLDRIKAGLDTIIAHKAGLSPGVLHCDAVKRADIRILLDEREALLAPGPEWGIDRDGCQPLAVAIEGWVPRAAETAWLAELSRGISDLHRGEVVRG